MFNRVEVKRNGLQAVKHYYIWGLVACIIYALLGGYHFQGGIHQAWDIICKGDFFAISTLLHTIFWIGPSIFYVGILRLFFILIEVGLGISWQAFIINVLEVGLFRFFLKNRHEDTPINELSVPFQKNYKNIVKVQFIKCLRIIVGFIFLVIPGIILSYKYYFVPYLLAENPDLRPEEALELSSQMTDGLKVDIFIFDLSFIGWYILSMCVPYLKSCVVYPYIYAARSELYVCLKERRL